MDPKQTLIGYLTALANRDIDTADELGRDLNEWVSGGGFVPASIHSAIAALQESDQ